MLVILGQWEYLYDCLKDTTSHNILYKFEPERGVHMHPPALAPFQDPIYRPVQLSRLNASMYNAISYYGVGA